jgi:hypothetical protein
VRGNGHRRPGLAQAVQELLQQLARPLQHRKTVSLQMNKSRDPHPHEQLK